MRCPHAICIAILSLGSLGALGSAAAQDLDALPASGRPGATVTVQGEGLLGGTNYTLRLRQQTPPVVSGLGTALTDATGAFERDVTVPQLAAGTYQLEALSAIGQIHAATPFSLLPPAQMSVLPNHGPPGTSVQVTITGLGDGLLMLDYAGAAVLGPVAVTGGAWTGSFPAPANRPVPLGQVAQIAARQTLGQRVVATATANFDSEPQAAIALRLASIGRVDPVRPGAKVRLSGRITLPNGRAPSEYRFTLVWRTAARDLFPIGTLPVVVDPMGNFQAVGHAPSLSAGNHIGSWMSGMVRDDELGFVYFHIGSGRRAYLPLTPVQYQPFDDQLITIQVQDLAAVPLENALVLATGNAVLVPLDEGGGGSGASAAVAGPRAKAQSGQSTDTWAAIHQHPNQFSDGLSQILDYELPLTGCPITLSSQVTPASGQVSFNIEPAWNEILDQAAHAISELDINTSVLGPGFATFTIRVAAQHLGYAPTNSQGICTGYTFDFRYDYQQELWFQRTGPDGEFTVPFDPNQIIVVPLPVCADPFLEFPAEPRLGMLPKTQVPESGGGFKSRFLGIRSYPNTGGANLVVEPAILSLAHHALAFGVPANPRLHIDGVDIGPMSVAGNPCEGEGVLNLQAEIPGLATAAPGIHQGLIVAEFGQGQQITKPFEFQVLPGPTWIANGAAYPVRGIQWSVEEQTLLAQEHVRFQDASESGIPYGVGSLDNDNGSGGTVSQLVTAVGVGTRNRLGSSDATLVNREDTDPPASNASVVGGGVNFGSPSFIPVLDTGQIPLFRYAWGVWPIADVTVGADIWFEGAYRYCGTTAFTDTAVSTSLVSQADASAGLDLWFDLSVILDLVSLSAFALPQFGVDLPIIVQNNQATNLEACFRFLLDVAYEVSVGWCPICVSADDTANLIDEETGGGCGSTPQIGQIPGCAGGSMLAAARRTKAVPSVPAPDQTSIDVDQHGESMVVYGGSDGNIHVSLMHAGQSTQSMTLPTGPGGSRPAVAYYRSGRAIMVWSESALSESAFLAQPSVQAAVPSQRMMYRRWQNGAWTAPQALTAPTTGEGGVALAACHDDDPLCPAGGEVLAVWSRDRAGDIRAHDFELRYAYFVGVGWSSVQAIDAATSASDSQPAPAYRNGQPVVVWVRNPAIVPDLNDPNPATNQFQMNLDQRRLAYRFLRQGAGVQIPASLPLGVASPSVVELEDDRLLVAFSVAIDPDAFIGTRQSLHTAFADNCSAGICPDWNVDERRDSLDRRIYVERPKAIVDGTDTAVLAFRMVGIDNPQPGDSPGVIAHTGDLAQLQIDVSSPAVPIADVTAMTVDGAINWKIGAAFDPSIGSMIVSALQGPALGQSAVKRMHAPRTATYGVQLKTISGTDGVVMAIVPRAPDYEVVALTATPDWFATAAGIKIEVTVRNHGPRQVGEEFLLLEAAWDGPPGVGKSASVAPIVVPEPGAGASVRHEFTLLKPAEFAPDEVHRLHVALNPQRTIPEADGRNNAGDIVIGALPPPTGLIARTGPARDMVFLRWTPPPSDPRVIAYRVYRTNPDGTRMAVGTSDVAGFVDFSALPLQHYTYEVTSYSAQLAESLPSGAVRTRLADDPVFGDGFEGAP